ncbi:FMN-dependent NADH-azoreductase [Thiohalobacter sp. COW1]|uniref:FMN dependent NADH:quinone oxidoreductase n=1 Tax=Thiohalobacter thiocyanaticus TaxID=585455 RepID=A0A1Z4VUA0_9GAMM|nr:MULTISPECIES: NAD(P)H-dependent oxidoreductase [Thiohalobacter]BAZ94774.1 FMN-dependent NADH-azoreductase [Thiohalobacter thiocyanaticus]BCO30158.1 FMN-dependent NADH-azoreductase [Thiohalobacter sp. COW1]
MNHTTNALNVLTVTASARQQGSVSRGLVAHLLDRLRAHHPDLQLRERDVSAGLPVVDADWIGASYTPAEQRDAAQRAALAQSDALVRELQDADVLVIGTPIYNFSIPASLKAWIDQVARVGETFRYTESGPQGLLRGRQAFLLLASGGTPVGSDIDFASGYLRQVLGFLGIEDVTVIAADRIMQQQDEAVAAAQRRIAETAAALRAAA